jgi:hypothetical protein
MSAVAGPGGVELSVRSGADGAMQRICVDHVLAGTGYHYDVRATGLFDDITLRSIVHARGFPRLQPGFASSVPGLYFAGLAAAGTFGPLLRFVAGTQWSSPRMAQSITARVAAHAS